MAKANRNIFKLGLVGRATTPNWMAWMSNRPEILERRQEIDLEQLYEISKTCNAVRRSIQALRDYIFKEGYEFKPAFSRRCKECGHEHDPDTKPEECEECGFTSQIDDTFANDGGASLYQQDEGEEDDSKDFGKAFGEDNDEPEEDEGKPSQGKKDGQSTKDDQWYEEPDETIPEQMKEFLKRVDKNGHSFTEMLKMYEEHLNVADDSFMIVRQDYSVNADGTIADWEVVKDGFNVAHPKTFKMIVDPATMEPGGKYWVCLEHRLRTIRDPATGMSQKLGRLEERPGNCGECGKQLYDVWYVSHEPGSHEAVTQAYIGPSIIKDPATKEEVLHPGEVLHNSKSSISYGYGYSAIISIYNMARTLVYMETYIQTFYREERTPRAALWIPTRNPKAIQTVLESAEDKNVSQGGHYVPKITYDPGETSRVPVQYTEFSKPPVELQMLEQRDEFYRRIGAAFGVAPVFHGNVDAVGLQSQGPTQWQVTNDAAKLAQDVYNLKLFPQLLQLFKIKEWNLELKPVEQKDEAAEWNNKLMEAQYAQLMQQLGFRVMGRDKNGAIEISSKVTEVVADPFGMGGEFGDEEDDGGGGFGDEADTSPGKQATQENQRAPPPGKPKAQAAKGKDIKRPGKDQE